MRTPALVALAILLGLHPAAAQRAGSPELSVVGVLQGKISTMDAATAVGVGGHLGIWLPGRFELEGQVDYSRPKQVRSAGRFQLIYVAGSLAYNIPVGRSFLYLRGGYGKLLQTDCLVVTFPCSNFGASLVAAGLKVPVGDRLGIRIEGRLRQRPVYSYYSSGASVGFVLAPFRSGGPVSRQPERDTDRDGVPDRHDRCPGTPPGALVDLRGCPTDSDHDGVFDGIDRCPGTPPGTPVNDVGCPVKRPD